MGFRKGFSGRSVGWDGMDEWNKMEFDVRSRLVGTKGSIGPGGGPVRGKKEREAALPS